MNLAVARGKWLRAYFWAQTAYNVVLFALNPETRMYEAMFSIFTVLILAASAGYAWDCARIVSWQARLAILAVSLTLPVLLYKLTTDTLYAQMAYVPSYLIVSLGECAIILTLGIFLAVLAPVVRGPSIPLALLWLALGAWSYAWTVGYPFHPEFWMRLNMFVPITLVVVGFGWAFFLQKGHESFRMQHKERL